MSELGQAGTIFRSVNMIATKREACAHCGRTNCKLHGRVKIILGLPSCVMCDKPTANAGKVCTACINRRKDEDGVL